MVDSFATAGELCEFIGLTPPSDLARLQSQLAMASSKIRAYCDQVLSPVVNDVITVYPSASTLLTLPERPVTAVSVVLVDGVATTAFYVVPRGIRSGTVASPGSAWTRGATVTYSHGYAETDSQYGVFRTICLEATARAYTMNERGQSEVLGGALVGGGATVLESAGYAPEIFLTLGEKEMLRSFRRGPVR